MDVFDLHVPFVPNFPIDPFSILLFVTLYIISYDFFSIVGLIV